MNDRPVAGKETRLLGFNERLFFLNAVFVIKLAVLVTSQELPASYEKIGEIVKENTYPKASELMKALQELEKDLSADPDLHALLVEQFRVAYELLAGEPPKEKRGKRSHVKLTDGSTERASG